MNNQIARDYVTFVNNYQQNITQILNTCELIQDNFDILFQSYITPLSPPQYHPTRATTTRAAPPTRAPPIRDNRPRTQSRIQTLPRTMRRRNRNPNTLFNNTLFTNMNNFLNNMNMNTNGLNETFFSAVPIVPTSQQINDATDLVPYASTDTIQHTCPIDLSTFNPQETVMRIRHCGHFFRPNNLRHWFQTNSRCPVCRFDIRPNIVSPIQGQSVSNNTESSSATQNNNSSATALPTYSDASTNTTDIQNNNENETTLLVENNENQTPILSVPHTPDNSTARNDVNNNFPQMQDNIGSILTGTLMTTFNTMMDSSLNEVDAQYRIFNTFPYSR